MNSLHLDVRQAARVLMHSRGFALAVVASLAIGMAVAIAALAFLNALLFRPFPGVSHQEQLVRVSASQGCGRPDCWSPMSSRADYLTLRDSLEGLQGLAAYTQAEFTVALPEVRTMRGLFTSADYFQVLGTKPMTGRAFQPSDETTHAAIAVISYSVWMGDFAGDPSVTARSIRVGGQNVLIVGVAPPFFAGIDLKPGDRPPGVWLPMWLADVVAPRAAADGLELRESYFVGRLANGVSSWQVQAQAALVATRLALSRGRATGTGRADVRRVWMTRPEYWRFTAMIVLPIPILVLALACVNAANLMLARGAQRQREIAVRLAIGAARGRVIRQLLIESAALAFLAAAASMPIASWGLQLASSPLRVPIPIDARVLALTLLTAAVTTVGFGLAPAIRATTLQPSNALGPVSAGRDMVPRQSRSRRVLVIAQVTLSLALLAAASQLVRTLQSQASSGGTPPDRVLIAQFDLGPLKLPAADADDFYRQLLDGAQRLPDVEAAGLARYSSVWTFGRAAGDSSIRVWQAADRADEGRVTIGGMVAGDLFQALGLHLAQGRVFTESEKQGPPRAAIVNQTFAATMEGGAVGGILRVAGRNKEFKSAQEVRVVGIVEPIIDGASADDNRPAPRVYLPAPLEPEPALALYLRARTKAAALAQPVRYLVARIAPQVPVGRIESLADLRERSLGPQLWLARAAAVLGLVGLLLATAGVYGVSAYSVAMRSRELAIRIAVGAGPAAILKMILGEWMRVAGWGVILGGGIALAVSRVVQAQYHGVRGLDRDAFAGAIALFLGAMFLASALPAVRACRIDPVENLRND